MLTLSTTTSVSEFETWSCFCAMRPAKSLSKNSTEWPSVQREMRDSTAAPRFGARMYWLKYDPSPSKTGRSTTKTPNNSANSQGAWPAKAAGPVASTVSMVRPRTLAVSASTPPARPLSSAARRMTAKLPRSAQRKNGTIRRGGGPAAGA